MAIEVLVNGCAGNMGREVVRAVAGAEDMILVAAVDPRAAGRSVGDLVGVKDLDLMADSTLAAALDGVRPQVMVDFTEPGQVMGSVLLALEHGVRPVVGTTGLSADQLAEIGRQVEAQGLGAVVAPNFAIGAVLMMQFAARAARYFPAVEIIELHHDGKKDAPSGTAIKTAELIRDGAHPGPRPPTQTWNLPEARGAELANVRIHSVRLPGLVAHQEVILGGAGQTLTIRHDSLHRESFMPGVLLAVRRVVGLQGLVYGLEHLLDL